jgi:uncharacterized membrane protein
MVPMAIPMLLFKANLRRIIPETNGMLGAFLLGAVGTVCGAVIGFSLLPHWPPAKAGGHSRHPQLRAGCLVM